MKIKWSRRLDGTLRPEECPGSKKSSKLLQLFRAKKDEEEPPTFERNVPRRASADAVPTRRRRKNSESQDHHRGSSRRHRRQEHRKVCGSAPSSPVVTRREDGKSAAQPSPDHSPNKSPPIATIDEVDDSDPCVEEDSYVTQPFPAESSTTSSAQSTPSREESPVEKDEQEESWSSTSSSPVKLVSCLRNPKLPPRIRGVKRRVHFAEGTKGDHALVRCRLITTEGSEAQTSVVTRHHLPQPVHQVVEHVDLSEDSSPVEECSQIVVEDQAKMARIVSLPTRTSVTDLDTVAASEGQASSRGKMEELVRLLESLNIPPSISVSMENGECRDLLEDTKKVNGLDNKVVDSVSTPQPQYIEVDEPPQPVNGYIDQVEEVSPSSSSSEENDCYDIEPEENKQCLNYEECNNNFILNNRDITTLPDCQTPEMTMKEEEEECCYYQNDPYIPYDSTGTINDAWYPPISFYPRILEPIFEDEASEDSALSDSCDTSSSVTEESSYESYSYFPESPEKKKEIYRLDLLNQINKEMTLNNDRRVLNNLPIKNGKFNFPSSRTIEHENDVPTKPFDPSYCIISLAGIQEFLEGICTPLESRLLSLPSVIHHLPKEILQNSTESHLETGNLLKNIVPCYSCGLQKQELPSNMEASSIFPGMFSPPIVQGDTQHFEEYQKALMSQNARLLYEPSIERAALKERKEYFACISVIQQLLRETLSPFNPLLPSFTTPLQEEDLQLKVGQSVMSVQGPSSDPDKKHQDDKSTPSEESLCDKAIKCPSTSEDVNISSRTYLRTEDHGRRPVIDISIKADAVSLQLWLQDQQEVGKAVAAEKTFNTRQELAQEIGRLGLLCETRTKELNLLKMRLRHAVLGFDAFSVVVKYMAEELKAFAHPSLADKLLRTELELGKAEKQLENYQKEIQFLREQHASELAALSLHLEQTHQRALDHLHEKHNADVQRLKDRHNQEVGELTGKFSHTVEGQDSEHTHQVKGLHHHFNKQIEELENQHRRQLEGKQLEYEKQLTSLTQQIARIRQQSQTLRANLAQMEDNFHKDADSKVQWLLSKKSELEKEVDSLKTVLEMKNSELHTLRTENMENKKELEKMELYKEKIKMLEAKTEDLQALVDEKVRVQRELSNEHQQLRDHFEKEAMVNKRLSLENEELAWKLRQSAENSGILSGGDSPEVLQQSSVSPLRSPSGQVFFQYAELEGSPQSPIRKVPCPSPSHRLPPKKSKMSLPSALPVKRGPHKRPPTSPLQKSQENGRSPDRGDSSPPHNGHPTGDT